MNTPVGEEYKMKNKSKNTEIEKNNFKKQAINSLESNALSQCPDIMCQFTDEELVVIGKLITAATERSIKLS